MGQTELRWAHASSAGSQCRYLILVYTFLHIVTQMPASAVSHVSISVSVWMCRNSYVGSLEFNTGVMTIKSNVLHVYNYKIYNLGFTKKFFWCCEKQILYLCHTVHERKIKPSEIMILLYKLNIYYITCIILIYTVLENSNVQGIGHWARHFTPS